MSHSRVAPKELAEKTSRWRRTPYGSPWNESSSRMKDSVKISVILGLIS